MAIERAVVSGYLAGVVATRNMLTCDVVPSGGDTQQLLWDVYLQDIYNTIYSILAPLATVDSYELQSYSGGQWIPYDLVAFPKTGGATGDNLPNAVAAVLLGKASGLRHMGRKFFSGVAESYTLGNTLTTAGMAVAASALLAYITPFTGIGGGTIEPGTVNSAGVFSPFVGGLVSSLLGSMRRRKPGVGI